VASSLKMDVHKTTQAGRNRISPHGKVQGPPCVPRRSVHTEQEGTVESLAVAHIEATGTSYTSLYVGPEICYAMKITRNVAWMAIASR
jgi:hypothetical protein